MKLAIPNAERIFHLAQAFQDGMSIEEVFELTKIDRWFLHNVRQIVAENDKPFDLRADIIELKGRGEGGKKPMNTALAQAFRRWKKLGFSDRQLAVNAECAMSLKFARSARRLASSPPTGSWIPAPPSSKRTRPITIPPTATRTKCAQATSARS